MAAQRISIQHDHTQDFHYRHIGRRNDAHEYLYQPQFTDWDSNSDTRVESSVGVLRDEPQYLSDLPDESMRQIIHSDSYPNRLAPGLNIYGHTISLENEAGVPPISIANMPEDGNYAFRVMAESEEEYPQDEDVIFYAASEEGSSDDERGFEGDDEDSDDDNEDGEDEYSDSHMNLVEGEEGRGELTEEYGEAMHMVEEVSFTRISRRSIFDRNYAETIVEEEFWEIKWPSGAWHSAFNRTEYN